jgi:hypothetical protein
VEASALLERPERGRNRRRAPRILHGDLLGYSDRRKDGLYHLLGTGRTLDLSETGLRATCREPMPLGKILSFELKVGENTHRFRGRVVWCAELEADARYDFGVLFQELDFGLARSLLELAGDAGSSDQITLRDAGKSHETFGQVEAAQFSPLSNKPVAEGPVGERELLGHLAPGTGAGASLQDLLGHAIASGPKTGYTSPVELRDAVARAAETLAEKDAATPVMGTRLPGRRGKPRAERDTDRLKPGKREGSMAGHFESGRLAAVVRSLGSDGRSGILEVVGQGFMGHAAFRDGKIVAARTNDEAAGQDAVAAILGLPRGDYRFRPDLLSSLVVEHELTVDEVLGPEDSEERS